MIKLSKVKQIDNISGIPLLIGDQLFYVIHSDTICLHDIVEDEVLWEITTQEKNKVGFDRPVLVPFDEDSLFYCGVKFIEKINKKTGTPQFVLEDVSLGNNLYLSDNTVKGILFDKDRSFSPAIIDLEGKTINKVNTGASKFNFYGIDNDTFMLWGDTEISIYNYQNEELLFKIETPPLVDEDDPEFDEDDVDIVGEPLKYGNVFIFSLYGTVVFAVDALTGKVIWKIDTATGNNGGMMSINNGILHIVNYWAYYEIDVLTGAIKREVDTTEILDVMEFKLLSKHLITKKYIVALFGRGNNSLVVLDRGDLSVTQTINLKGNVTPKNFMGNEDRIITRNKEGVLDIFSFND